jgi:hypothetical protein
MAFAKSLAHSEVFPKKMRLRHLIETFRVLIKTTIFVEKKPIHFLQNNYFFLTPSNNDLVKKIILLPPQYFKFEIKHFYNHFKKDFTFESIIFSSLLLVVFKLLILYIQFADGNVNKNVKMVNNLQLILIWKKTA